MKPEVNARIEGYFCGVGSVVVIMFGANGLSRLLLDANVAASWAYPVALTYALFAVAYLFQRGTGGPTYIDYLPAKRSLLWVMGLVGLLAVIEGFGHWLHKSL